MPVSTSKNDSGGPPARRCGGRRARGTARCRRTPRRSARCRRRSPSRRIRSRTECRCGLVKQAGAQAEGAQQRLDHARGRGLAVGAGEVDDRDAGLRVAEQVDQPPDPVEGRLEPVSGQRSAQRRASTAVAAGRRPSSSGGGVTAGILGARPTWTRRPMSRPPADSSAPRREPCPDGEPPRLPEKPTLDGLEERWAPVWEAQGTYRFDRTRTREQVYSIDTPPPTVSGSLHVGHVFSLHPHRLHRPLPAHARPRGLLPDGLGRQRPADRAPGAELLRRALRPVAALRPRLRAARRARQAAAVPISRRNFVELCERLTVEDEKAFEELWRRLGLSVDWSHTYQTIDAHARRASQRAFLRNLARGEAYQAEAPTLWDVTFRTAVAQAELEDRERAGRLPPGRASTAPDGGAMHHRDHAPRAARRLRRAGRPPRRRALPAAVRHHRAHAAVRRRGAGRRPPPRRARQGLRHRDDLHLRRPHRRDLVARAAAADPPDHRLGRPAPARDAPQWPRAPSRPATAYAGSPAHGPFTAKERMVELLRETGDLVGEPAADHPPGEVLREGRQAARDRHHAPVVHPQRRPRRACASACWRAAASSTGTRRTCGPLRQLGRGPQRRLADLAPALLRRAVPGLVPRSTPHGEPVYDEPLLPDEASLPVDPSSDVPARATTSRQRGVPGGFVGDPDVMDTWATSSLTPQIAGGWERDPDLFGRVFPMDLRPQAHEIIRTWLFSTVVRAHSEHDCLPWSTRRSRGWILDPDRKKMSKSKGNVVTPLDLLEEHGADAVRYWAASGRPGTDTAFDVGQMKIGRRLAIKLLNACKFVLGFGAALPADVDGVTEPLDRAMLAELRRRRRRGHRGVRRLRLRPRARGGRDVLLDVLRRLRRAGQGPRVRRARRGRRGVGQGRARDSPCRCSCGCSRRSCRSSPRRCGRGGRRARVHRAPWPTADELAAGAGGDPALLSSVGLALSELRKAKSERKVSMRAELASAAVSGPGVARGRRRGRRPARRRPRVLGDLTLGATRRRSAPRSRWPPPPCRCPGHPLRSSEPRPRPMHQGRSPLLRAGMLRSRPTRAHRVHPTGSRPLAAPDGCPGSRRGDPRGPARPGDRRRHLRVGRRLGGTTLTATVAQPHRVAPGRVPSRSATRHRAARSRRPS